MFYNTYYNTVIWIFSNRTKWPDIVIHGDDIIYRTLASSLHPGIYPSPHG